MGAQRATSKSNGILRCQQAAVSQQIICQLQAQLAKQVSTSHGLSANQGALCRPASRTAAQQRVSYSDAVPHGSAWHLARSNTIRAGSLHLQGFGTTTVSERGTLPVHLRAAVQDITSNAPRCTFANSALLRAIASTSATTVQRCQSAVLWLHCHFVNRTALLQGSCATAVSYNVEGASEDFVPGP